MNSVVTPILPCSDLDAAETWWAALGFRRPAGQNHDGYRMLHDASGAGVHLRLCDGEGLDPTQNPFGVYIYTPDVDAMAAKLPNDVIGAVKAPVHQPWGMYEVALNGPDGVLVRIGWPSDQVAGARKSVG